MGKIRVRTLGDESFEDQQKKEAKARKEAKDLKKGKTHIKGVGLKGGQQVSVVEGVELKPEIEALLNPTLGQTEDAEPKKAAKKKKARVRSSRYQAASEMVDRSKLYPLKEALALLKKTATTKFDATVEVHININGAILDKDKPSLSGTINLPHGTGKKRRIAIADEELLKKVAEGKIEFDVLVAHPSMMAALAKVARILGPKGLMPNPKNGTVNADPEKRAKELAGGEVTWKTEPDHPVIHLSLGKVSYDEAKISENLKTLVKSIGTSKMTKLTLSSSMGPGIKVDFANI